MLDLIQHFLLIFLIILEIFVMIYLFYINRKRHKAEMKYWQEMSEHIAEVVKEYNEEHKSEKS